MTPQSTTSTEDHIKAVAKRVFIEKGYAATTTRDIAEAAEVNLALINYYFRSKEKLFKLVFDEVFVEFFGSMMELINKDLPLKQKFEEMIEKDIAFMLKNPDMPVFVMNEIRQSGEDFVHKLLNKEAMANSLLFKQIQVAIEKGEMRNINPAEIMILILSNIQFVFVAKPMIKTMLQLNDADYNNFILQHKERIKDIIFPYLFLK